MQTRNNEATIEEKPQGSAATHINLLKYVDIDFIECISDLLSEEEVLKLENYVHHNKSTRLEHSLNVAYYSYKVAKYMGYNYKAVARGGLLHDLFFHSWGDLSKKASRLHLTRHPKISLANAERLTMLSDIEKDIILKHMWPLTPAPPKYMESFIVSLVDKYSAVMEAVGYRIGQEDTVRTKAVKTAIEIKLAAITSAPKYKF